MTQYWRDKVVTYFMDENILYLNPTRLSDNKLVGEIEIKVNKKDMKAIDYFFSNKNGELDRYDLKDTKDYKAYKRILKYPEIFI